MKKMSKARIIVTIWICVAFVGIIVCTIGIIASLKGNTGKENTFADVKRSMQSDKSAVMEENNLTAEDSATPITDSNTMILPEYMLGRESDSKYFVPISDDYIIITSTLNKGGEVGDMEEDKLISFDENGNVIQELIRNINQYYLVDGFDINTYYSSGAPEGIVLVEDTTYYDNLIQQRNYELHEEPSGFLTVKGVTVLDIVASGDYYEGSYISKPDVGCTYYNNEAVGPEEFEISKYVSPTTDDYVYMRLEYENAAVGNNPSAAEILYSFNEDGRAVDFARLIIYDSDELLTAVIDAEEAISGIGSVEKSGRKRDGNKLLEHSDDGALIRTTKFEVGKIACEKKYFSVPFLTAKQWKNYLATMR